MINPVITNRFGGKSHTTIYLFAFFCGGSMRFTWFETAGDKLCAKLSTSMDCVAREIRNIHEYLKKKSIISCKLLHILYNTTSSCSYKVMCIWSTDVRHCELAFERKTYRCDGIKMKKNYLYNLNMIWIHKYVQSSFIHRFYKTFSSEYSIQFGAFEHRNKA